MIDMRHYFIGLLHDVHQHFSLYGIDVFHPFCYSLPDGRNIPGRTCQRHHRMRLGITPDGSDILQTGRIHAPHLRISILRNDRNILYHPANTRFVTVQQHRLAHRIRRAEQFPRHRSNHDNGGHIATPVGIIKSPSCNKLHPEHFPESRVGFHGIHFHRIGAVGHRNQGDRCRNKCRTGLYFGQWLHTVLHESRRTGCIIIPTFVFLTLQMHLAYIERAAAVHFRLNIGIFHLPSNHNRHNHGDGKCRTQYEYGAQ